MSWELRLWGAQDALLAALRTQKTFDIGGPTEVGVSLGLPVNLLSEHVWIDGSATGSLTCELSGTDADGTTSPDAESFELKVGIFVSAAGDYEDCRGDVIALADAVLAALGAAFVPGIVDSWSISRYELASGTEGSNRILALELTIPCECW